MRAGTIALLALALLGLAAIGGGLVIGGDSAQCEDTRPAGDSGAAAASGCAEPNDVPAVALLVGGSGLLVLAAFGAVLRAVVS